MFDEACLSDEDETPLICAACGGDFSRLGDTRSPDLSIGYSFIVCRWCTRGSQSALQRSRWESRRADATAAPQRPDSKSSGVRLRAGKEVCAPAPAVKRGRR
jgi:hypothetical protein